MSAPKIKRKKIKLRHHFPGAPSAPSAAATGTPVANPNQIPFDVSSAIPKPPLAPASNSAAALLNPEAARHERTLALLQEFHRRDQHDYSHTGGLLNRQPQPKPAATAAATPTPAPAPSPANTSRPGHSTGPITAEGKARSAQNAFRHGLTAPLGRAMEFLPHEDPDEHERLRLQFNEQFVPMTSAEIETVAEIVDALWLARRARDLQTRELFMTDPDQHLLSLYLRYETAHTRAHHAAIKTLLAMQKDRRNRNQHHEEWNEPVVWGFANRYDLDAFTFNDPLEPEENEDPYAPPPPPDTSFRSSVASTVNTPSQPTAASPETAPSQPREEVKLAA